VSLLSKVNSQKPAYTSFLTPSLFLAGKLAFGTATRLFAQSRIKAALYEAALGTIDRRAAGCYRARDVLIAGGAIGSQQDLRPLQPSRGALAGAQQSAKLVALLGSQIDM